MRCLWHIMTHWREPLAVNGIGELLGPARVFLACVGSDWFARLRALSSNHLTTAHVFGAMTDAGGLAAAGGQLQIEKLVGDLYQ